MQLRYLNTLISIAESGSFQAAARQLGLSEAAISIQISNLEKELGIELFDRRRRPPKLTPIGRSVILKAREITTSFQELLGLGTIHQVTGTVLRFGMSSQLSSPVKAASLNILQARYPNLSLESDEGHTSKLIEHLARGELDLALVASHEQVSNVEQTTLIGHDPLLLVAPVNVRALHDKAIASLPFVIVRQQETLCEIVCQIAQKSQGTPLRKTLTVESLEVALHLVRQGNVLTAAPRSALTGEWLHTVSGLPMNTPSAAMQILLCRSEGYVTREADALDSVLTRELRQAISGLVQSVAA